MFSLAMLNFLSIVSFIKIFSISHKNIAVVVPDIIFSILCFFRQNDMEDCETQ